MIIVIIGIVITSIRIISIRLIISIALIIVVILIVALTHIILVGEVSGSGNYGLGFRSEGPGAVGLCLYMASHAAKIPQLVMSSFKRDSPFYMYVYIYTYAFYIKTHCIHTYIYICTDMCIHTYLVFLAATQEKLKLMQYRETLDDKDGKGRLPHSYTPKDPSSPRLLG